MGIASSFCHVELNNQTIIERMLLMNNPIKTVFLVGLGIVGGCALLVSVIQNNKIKIKASFRAAKEAWSKTREIEEASIVSTSVV